MMINTLRYINRHKIKLNQGVLALVTKIGNCYLLGYPNSIRIFLGLAIPWPGWILMLRPVSTEIRIWLPRYSWVRASKRRESFCIGLRNYLAIRPELSARVMFLSLLLLPSTQRNSLPTKIHKNCSILKL